MIPNFIAFLSLLAIVILCCCFWMGVKKDVDNTMLSSINQYSKPEIEVSCPPPYFKNSRDLGIDTQRFVTMILNGENAYPATSNDFIYGFVTLLEYIPEDKLYQLQMMYSDEEIKRAWLDGRLDRELAPIFQNAAIEMAKDAGYGG
jgi:hypothetical protein